ncbi:DUF899 family protein [Evansella sp. AB-rgal1]|uniref:DUF899 family protein n=1 Tax=Evansella sp. AB-rgal1 TaxID=3242696 RepID=UPI00359E309E
MDQKQLLEEIERVEKEIVDKKDYLRKLRSKLQGSEVENYVFLTSNEVEVSLLDLFGEKNELILIHNMGKSCSYCTMWADGFNSVYHHIIEKAAFVVTSPDHPSVQEDFAAERRWAFPLISTINNSFKEDMGFKKNGLVYPGVSVFKKEKNGVIRHHTKAHFGPGDQFCNVWSLFDLLPSGYEEYRPLKKINKKSPFQLTNNIAVQVHDYEKAITFYEETLGFELKTSYDNETKFFINGTYFFVENNPQKSTFFEFAVDDIVAMKEVLLKKGCKITKEYNDKSLMLADPYGLKFHIFEVKSENG